MQIITLVKDVQTVENYQINNEFIIISEEIKSFYDELNSYVGCKSTNKLEEIRGAIKFSLQKFSDETLQLVATNGDSEVSIAHKSDYFIESQSEYVNTL